MSSPGLTQTEAGFLLGLVGFFIVFMVVLSGADDHWAGCFALFAGILLIAIALYRPITIALGVA